MSQAVLDFLSRTGVWVGGLGLAAFLALFWVLRGAPLGQAVRAEEDDDAPRGGYRDRVVAAVTLGMVLIVVGGYLAVTRGVAWAAVPFALGFGTVLTLVLINSKYRHGSPTLRRTLDVSTAALNASLVAGVLIVVNVLAFRYGGRAVDMTAERAYSLSVLSVNQIRSVPKPVTFTAFYGRSPSAAQQYERVQELLELYRAANPEKVRLEHVDPDRDPVRYEALVKLTPDVEITRGGGVVIAYGDGDKADRFVVRNADLFDAPAVGRFNPDVDQVETSFKGEDAVTTALMRLREGKKAKVVFTTGHGEPSLDEDKPTVRGLGLLKGRLVATGSEVVPWSPLTEDLPADAAVIVVAGPTTPFKPEEAARLQSAVDRKVPVLLVIGDRESTGLGDFLRAFDVSLGRGLVIEPRLNNPREQSTVFVPVIAPRHPIVEPLANLPVLFPRPAPMKLVSQAEPGKAVASVVPTVLLRTTPDSWVEPDVTVMRPKRDPTDEAGPVSLAVAVTDRLAPGDARDPTPRLVVLSSAFFADNRYVQLASSNLDLVMNAVNWLRGKQDAVGIAPKTHTSMALDPDPVLRSRLVMVPTVMAVLLILTLGLTTYLARRA